VIGLISQLVLLNIGLRNFEQAVFIPMFETMSASITIIFGIMYFRTYDSFSIDASTFCFCAGIVILIIGLFLTSRRHSPTREEMVARLNEHSPRAKPHGTHRHGRHHSFGDTVDAPLLSGANVETHGSTSHV